MKVFPKYDLLYDGSIWNLNDIIYMKIFSCNKPGYKFELEFGIKELDTLLYFNHIDNEWDYEVAQHEFIEFLTKFVNHLCKDLIVMRGDY